MEDFPPPPPPSLLIDNSFKNNIPDNFFPPPPPPIAQMSRGTIINGKVSQKLNHGYITPYAENPLYFNDKPSTRCNENSKGIYQKIGSRNSHLESSPLNLKNREIIGNGIKFVKSQTSADEVDELTNMLINNLNSTTQNLDYIGNCTKCNFEIIGEESGCTAIGKLYHIACFNCYTCDISLCGHPFYALDDKLYCEKDYMDTLEKCSACTQPIMNRILRATGKPYHPQCFTCIVCGKCLDGIPFTLDATNQFHCIEDFHRRFAPKCAMCNELITPQKGESETIRIIAMEKSFHLDCYRCEDCNLLLTTSTGSDNKTGTSSSCYPLDGQILCKDCNAYRINRMTSQLNHVTDL